MFRESDIGEKGIVLDLKQTDEKVFGGVSLWWGGKARDSKVGTKTR